MKKPDRGSCGLILTLAALAVGAANSPLRAQATGNVHLGDGRTYCVDDEALQQPGVSFDEACEVVPGVVASASAYAIAGRLGITTDVRGSLSNYGGYPLASAVAQWGDQLRWSDPSVSTILFTVALHGSTFASYNGVGSSGAYGSGSFSVAMSGDRILTVNDDVNFREGVGYGRPPDVAADVLSHAMPYSITRAYAVGVTGASSMRVFLSMVMGSQLNPEYVEGYSGESGSDFGDTAEFSGLAFLDEAGKPLTGVNYSFDNGTRIYAQTTTTPEPVGMILIGTGLATILVMRQRKPSGKAA